MQQSAVVKEEAREQAISAIRNFIVSNFLFGEDSELSDEDSLLDAGVIDSTGVVELVAFLEEHFGIQVDDHDLVPDNLDSLQRIADYVQRKTRA